MRPCGIGALAAACALTCAGLAAAGDGTPLTASGVRYELAATRAGTAVTAVASGRGEFGAALPNGGSGTVAVTLRGRNGRMVMARVTRWEFDASGERSTLVLSLRVAWSRGLAVCATGTRGTARLRDDPGGDALDLSFDAGCGAASRSFAPNKGRVRVEVVPLYEGAGARVRSLD